MRRRDFIAFLGGAALAWPPLVARAQLPHMPAVGVLGATSASGFAAQLAAFRRGLSEAGVVEGRDAAIEYRWADDQYCCDAIDMIGQEGPPPLRWRPIPVHIACDR